MTKALLEAEVACPPWRAGRVGGEGRPLGFQGRKAKYALSEPTPCRVLWERQRRPKPGFLPLRKFQLDVR